MLDSIGRIENKIELIQPIQICIPRNKRQKISPIENYKYWINQMGNHFFQFRINYNNH